MVTKSTSLIRYFLFKKKEEFLSWFPVRVGWLLVAFGRCAFHILTDRNMYLAFAALLRYERDVTCLIGEKKIGWMYRNVYTWFLRAFLHGRNQVLLSYVASYPAQQCRIRFAGFGEEHLVRMRYPKKHIDDPGRQGDLIILKPYLGKNERGVLFIQYDEGVQRFVSLYDVESLAKYYRFVVEPSTSGYQNPMFFLLFGLKTDVVIEAQYQPDFEYLQGFDSNLIPIRLGAGDWADPELFQDGTEVAKKYDIVMIANWLSWKRHDLFFRSLARIKDRVRKVAVIGYPIEGRTMADVQRECMRFGVIELVDFYEKISPAQVGEILRQSKLGILLSKDEGANRGIYECFFSGLPILLSDANRGVNRDHITPQVGLVATDKELPEIMVKMIERYQDFRPRQWALLHTGFKNSTRKLNEFLKKIALEAGEAWTNDIFSKHNSPHARFAYPEEQAQADRAVSHLFQFLRKPDTK